jgi:hypothetical protein
MTLPDERYAAIHNTERFLMNLCNPRLTPRVPRAVRQRAQTLLKHYPSVFELDQLAERSPDVIVHRMEPLTRLMRTYEESRDDQMD